MFNSLTAIISTRITFQDNKSDHPQERPKLFPPKISNRDAEKLLPTLSEILCNRNTPQDYMSDERIRTAYRSYYHEQSFYKALSILEEVLLFPSVKNFLNKQDCIQIADLATGTGGFVQGILHGLTEESFPEIMVTLHDRSESALFAAALEIRELYSGRPLTIGTHHGVIPDFFPPLSGLHILSWGNMLNEWEMSQASAKKLLESIDLALTDGGILLIAEPADRFSSRTLHQFSNHLLDFLPDFQILAPCPNNRRGDCPALLDERDWCHEDRPQKFSQELIHASKRLGHIKDSLKMSYLVCQKKASLETDLSMESGKKDVDAWKMISDMTHERGLSQSTFCNGREWIPFRMLKRHKSPANDSFFRLKKGQTIKMELSSSPQKKGDFFDITGGTAISLFLEH